jgi:Ca2+-binding RTX toxin-like protein
MSHLETAAILSSKIYDDLQVSQTFGNNDRYQVLDIRDSNSSTGYYGAIIKDIQTNKVFLASRGTEITSIQDLVADISLGLGGLAGNQYSDAIQFLNNYETNNQNNPNYIPVTESVGHSLGGYIAQLVGISKGQDVTVFGSPGADGGLDDLENLGVDVDGYDKSRITSVEAEHDPIVGTGSEISGINTVMINVEDRVDQTLTGQLASSYAHMVSLTGFDEINVFSSLGNYTFALTAFGAKLVYHNSDYYRGEIAGDYTQTVSSSALLGFASTENGDTVNFYEKIAVVDSVSGADTIFYQQSDGNIYALVNQTDGTKALSYKDSNGDAVLKTFASLDNMSNLTAQEQYIAQEIIYQKYLAERRAAEELFNDNPDIANSTEYSNLPQEVKDQIDDHLANGQVVSDESAMTGEVISGDLGSDPLGVGNGNEGLGIGSGDFNALQLVWVVQNGSKEHQIQAALQLYSKIKTEGTYNSSTETYTLDGATIENVANSYGGSAVKLSYGGIAQSYITLYDQGDFQQKVVETVGLDGRTNSAQITLADGLVNEIYRGEPVEIHYPENFVFGYAGGYIANIVGQQLANGELAHDIISSSITRTLGQNLGEVLDFLSTGQNDLREAFFDPIFGVNGIHAPRPDILDDFLSNLQVSVLSAVSTQIVGELGEAIGIEGIGGEIFDVTAGTLTTGIANELFGIQFNDMPAGVYATLANAGFDWSAPIFDSRFVDPDFIGPIDPNVPNTTVGEVIEIDVINALASYAGSRLAGEVISPESEMAGIFGSIGSAISTAIASGAIASGSAIQGALTLGFAGGPIGIAIGAFVGTVFGTALGNAFGGEDNPSSWGMLSYNKYTGEYYMADNTQNDGGGLQIGADLSNAVASGVNSILETTGGALRSNGVAQGLTLGWKEGTFLVIDDGGQTSQFDNSGEAITYATFKLLKSYDLVGGHAVIMRAWHNSDAGNLQEFREDIGVAEAFMNYLQNPTGILALMMDQPESALAQSWAAILQRAAELELHLPHEKDLDGGWNEVLIANGVDPESLANIDETTLTVIDPVTGEETVFHHLIGPGYEIVRMEGSDDDDIIQVIVDGPSITYVDAGSGDDVINGSDDRDVIFGGTGDDIINGNDGDDWLNGGAGNDTINGNNGLDLIVGGDDNDILVGGDQDDSIYGGFGDDELDGGIGNDRLYGGAGNDILHSVEDGTYDEFYGGEGDDTIYGFSSDKVVGGAGNDLIIWESAINGDNGIKIQRGDGHDTVEVISNVNQYIAFDRSFGINELWFHHDPSNSNNLIISVVGEDQSVKVLDYKNSNVFVEVMEYYTLDLANLENTNYAPYLSVHPTGQYNHVSDLDLDGMTGALSGEWGKHDYSWRFLRDIDANLLHLDQGKSILYSDIVTFMNGSTSDPNWQAQFAGLEQYQSNVSIAYSNDLFMYMGGEEGTSIVGHYAMGGIGNDTITAPSTEGGNTYMVHFYGDAGDDTITGGNKHIEGYSADILVGGLGNDYIHGGSGNDLIWGSQGNDTLIGGNHNDIIKGGVGNDTIYGEDGDDSISGNDGDDILFGDGVQGSTEFSGDDTIHGNAGNDILYGSYGRDTLDGGDDNDTIYGGHDNDVLIGGSGDDTLHGENGDDIISGDEGADTLIGGSGNDTLNGGSGNDNLSGGSGDDEYAGGSGDDVYTYLGGNDKIFEIGIENDKVIFDSTWSPDDIFIAGNQIIFDAQNSIAFNDISLIETFSFDGYDDMTLEDLPSKAYLDISTKDDFFTGFIDTNITGNLFTDNGNGVDVTTVEGTLTTIAASYVTAYGGTVQVSSNGDFTYTSAAGFVGIDRFFYTATDVNGSSDSSEVIFAVGHDVFSGDINNNSFTGNHIHSESDVLAGYAGDDYFNAEAGNDLIFGGAGNDEVHAGSGNDIVYGGAGNDDLRGNDGDDILIGGDGFDILNGSTGADTFVFEAESAFNDIDWIESFEISDNNVIDLSDVLNGFYNKENDTVTDFVQITQSGSHSYLSVDQDGGADNFIQIAEIRHVTVLPSVAQMVADGNLVLARNVNAQNDLFGAIVNASIAGNVFTDNGNGIDKASLGTSLSIEAGAFATVNGGLVVLSSNGDFTYTPATDFVGEDSFMYEAFDLSGNSDSAEINFAVGHYTFIGTSNNDYFVGNHIHSETDVMIGKEGDDYFNAEGGDDFVFGGSGNDEVHGGAGADTIYGGEGNDDLRGNNDNDILIGGAGNDVLNGSTEDDLLYGGAGTDSLYGGSGSDIFVFEKNVAFEGIDEIQDFEMAENDKLDISDLLIGYDPLEDAIADFVQITDNGSHSYLYVDVDGGADNFVQIATIYSETGLTDESALEISGNLITI